MSEIILDTYNLELNNENFSEGIEDAEKQVKEFKSEMNKFSSFLKESVISALVKTSDSGLELNEVFKDLKVTTNEATNELSDMKQSLLDISNNYGKSFTGITEGINNVRQATEQANKEYEKTIGIGSTMKDIFENDVKGSINSVSPIIENIGQTSGDAYESIENEAQNSLNKNTVLLNTLNKHMVNFASSGINANTFTAMVVEGANSVGALDVAVSALITKFVMLNGTKISSFFSTLVSSIQRVGIQMTALSVKARAAALATSALKAGLTFGASMAVFALIKGIKEYNDKLEQNKLRIEQTKIASDNLKESMEEFRTNLDTESIDNVRNALTDLANAMGYTEAIAKKARLEKELEGLKKAPFTGWEKYRQNEIEKELKDSKKIIDDYNFKKKYIEMEIYHTQKAQAEKAQSEEYEEKEEYSQYFPPIISHIKPIDLDKKYELFKNTFEDLEHEADVLNEKLSQLEGQDRIPMLENLNNIYEKQKDALHLLNNERREEAAQILGLNKEAIAQMTYEEMRSIEVTEEQRDRLNELIPALQKTSEKWWNVSSAQKENLSEMKNINEEIKNLKREHVKTIADAESKIVEIYEREGEEKLKAIQKEHDDELEMLEKHHDKKQQEYDKDLDNYKKHIQSQIDAINEASDKEDFDKNLAEKQEELNEIQMKINELSLVTGDNESARAALIEKAELENEFAEKQEEIDEFIADRNKNLKIEALEESLADYEEYIENQKSIADSEFEHKKQLLDKELQDKTQALEAEYSKEKLYSKARKMLLSGEYDELTTMFMDYQKKTSDGWSSLGDTIEKDFISQLEEAKALLEELEESGIDVDIDPSDSDNGSTKKKSRTSLGGGFEDMTDKEFERYKQNKKDYEAGKNQERAAKDNQDLRDKYGIENDDYSYEDLKDYYHEGGWVTSFKNRLFNNLRSDEVPAVLQTGEFVLSRDMISQISNRNNSLIQQPNVITIGSLMEFNGSVDNSARPMIQTIAENSLKKLESMLEKNGLHTEVKGLRI